VRGDEREKEREGGLCRGRPEKDRAFGTYFLLLLLFSVWESLRCASSDGDVAELFSFLGRAAGMVVGKGTIKECGGRDLGRGFLRQ